MTDEIWVLGATGRTGGAVARRLHDAGASLALVGRDRRRLESIAAELGGAPRVVVGSLDTALAELAQHAPAVVINTVGPFPATAPRVARACPPGTHYVDVANEFRAVQALLALDREAAATDRAFVTGAGFGVLATESVLLRLCEGTPRPSRVRVDAIASVATEPGLIGSALAASIVDVLSTGGRQVRHGRVVRSHLAGEPAQLTTPDGDVVTTASVASGELLAAWRASNAEFVVAASGSAPSGALARLAMPLASAVLRIPGASDFAARQLARIPVNARERPRRSSWARARVEWPSGRVQEGWLRAGDGIDFTAAVTTQVALRLARGEGRPGAHTPGALFGPALALAAGDEFLIGERATAPA